jgi:transposase InsO family protein
MNLFDSFVAAETDYRRVPTERLSHPKDGALAQQPKAERAPHSAVVRPQAAGKSRPTSTTLVGVFVSFFAAGGSVFATATCSKRERGRNLAGPVERFAVASHEHKAYWFEPTPRGRFFLFLVQDRLRASDVLHRDWDWSGWL